MEIETYHVPEMDDETIELGDEIVLGINGIIEDDTGLIGDQILAKALSIRVRNSAACITRLLNFGFVHEAHILLRSIAEATILFHAAIDNLGFKDVFALEEAERVYGLLRKQRLLIDPNQTEKLKELDEQIKVAKEKCKTVKDSTYDLGDLAVKNRCKYIYTYFYTLGHGYVHCLPNTISDYVTILGEKNIQFNHTPNLEERDMVLAASLQCYARMGKKWAQMRKDEALIKKADSLFEKLKGRFTFNILKEE